MAYRKEIEITYDDGETLCDAIFSFDTFGRECTSVSLDGVQIGGLIITGPHLTAMLGADQIDYHEDEARCDINDLLRCGEDQPCDREVHHLNAVRSFDLHSAQIAAE